MKNPNFNLRRIGNYSIIKIIETNNEDMLKVHEIRNTFEVRSQMFNDEIICR